MTSSGRSSCALQRDKTGSVVAFENRYRHKDGSYRWLLWSATATEDGLTYATARDVTRHKQMEKELRESREQALAASRLKSEFVANMSHEIRTPLNGVVSMSELLIDSGLTAEQHEYAHVAMTSAEALMRVVDDILDFSKIEAGKLDIVDEEYSIEATLADVCEIVGLKAHEKGLKLTPSIDPRRAGRCARGLEPCASGAAEPSHERREVHLRGRGRHARGSRLARRRR